MDHISRVGAGSSNLLSPCLTNRAPLQQISLLPTRVNITRADLRAAGGAWERSAVSVHVCSCLQSTGGGEGGGENTQEIRDLLITLCSVSPSLPPSLPPSFSPSSVDLPLGLFIEGCRGLCFWLCSLLQASSHRPSLKTSSGLWSEPTSACVSAGRTRRTRRTQRTRRTLSS